MRTRFMLATACLLALITAGQARTQCMLANPSFELPGTGGANFAGWNQFGVIGVSTTASHGSKAAKVSGPNTGSWGVSGYWQTLDTAPGDRWTASVYAWHTGVNPLQGQSTAILNIEWRDAGANLISYESFTVLDPGTPLDEVQYATFTSQAAPVGTATTRILLAALQGPSDSTPDVYFDSATFEKAGPSSPESQQWNDFPGGRTLPFSGYSWRVKGPGYYGPGPSLFSDSSNCTWVDIDGRLHMTIKNLSGNWYSTEITLEDVLGYGDYIFTTRGRLDTLDPKAVLGLFLWEYGSCYDPAYLWWNPYNEIDIEYSRWGNIANDIGQFVAQPYDYPGNLVRFDATFAEDEVTSHAMRWLPDRVEYRSWRGGPDDESPANLIYSWTYSGPHIPRPGRPRVHINLWQLNGHPSTDQEVVLDSFTFEQECSGPNCEPAVAVPTTTSSGVQLQAPAPNPFSAQTQLAFTLEHPEFIELNVYDVTGRHIRTLQHGYAEEGPHRVTWDGKNEAGRRVAGGVYLYQLRTAQAAETRRVLLVP